MKSILFRLKIFILKKLLKIPILIDNQKIYKSLGVKIDGNAKISSDIKLVGDYSNLSLAKDSEVNIGCFLLAKDKIFLGENSTLAYNVSVLTSANPNGPKNKLSKIYPKMKAPVVIGANTWIGANSIILPGITIGEFCVVAAGSVVTKDVPSYTVVAGVPAKFVKNLNCQDFE